MTVVEHDCLPYYPTDVSPISVSPISPASYLARRCGLRRVHHRVVLVTGERNGTLPACRVASGVPEWPERIAHVVLAPMNPHKFAPGSPAASYRLEVVQDR